MFRNIIFVFVFTASILFVCFVAFVHFDNRVFIAHVNQNTTFECDVWDGEEKKDICLRIPSGDRVVVIGGESNFSEIRGYDYDESYEYTLVVLQIDTTPPGLDVIDAANYNYRLLSILKKQPLSK